MKALRSLDAATPPTFEQYERAAATLDRIVATRPDPPRRRPVRAWMLVPALAAAVAVLLLVVPWGRSGRAYATWTPTPVALSPAEIGVVGPACQGQLRQSPDLDLDRAELVLAERRGEYVALLYRHDNPGTVGFCLAHNLPGTDDVDDVKTGGGSGAESFDAAEGRFKDGALAVYPEGVTITEGAAGPDVAGLTIHTQGLTVRATVNKGHWVAWWPAAAVEKDGEGKWRDVPRTYDVRLNDGRTLIDVKPAR
ncbi:hypothetical protein JIG36_10375 [Actinoplanes sp. LDG1-06]|uniref:Uncharacterized protein n=1 Tax=Paractinoplanes ovalisporus TaxID=2810368 RepID=A0ABS2A803_9ACTN|nr:hypothetical protein [Actinoplanes ovalisporus]MBM2615961.1 hypothetical protein [Actinoplanes ovalisporus]